MENIQLWIGSIIAILSGISVCIPLVIELVKYIKKSVQEKNWTNVVQLVLKFMSEAENDYKTGEERKQYVLDAVDTIKDTLNYEVDMDVISTLIDSVCDASKTINAKAKKTTKKTTTTK